MKKTETCIYCSISFNPAKGAGDHVLSVQLGEFKNGPRFRRICTSCNNNIGRSEQQLLSCGPESFFRDIVNPRIPPRRQRGRSRVKAAMGIPAPQSTIDHGDHRELVRRSRDNPTDVFPVDHIVIHDDQGEEYFIEMFIAMRPEQLKECVKKRGINKIDKIWFHCDMVHELKFQQLLKAVWPKAKMFNLPVREAGVTQIEGCITFKANDHYFRSLAKIAFHYYLIYTRRGFRGDEPCFKPIRDFIMNGGNEKAIFGHAGPKFVMPFGKIPSGGVITPTQWCHIIAAEETDQIALVYLQLFVGPGCVPQSHYIKLADINSKIFVPYSTWGHVYLYDRSQESDRYAGEVHEAQITRIQ